MLFRSLSLAQEKADRNKSASMNDNSMMAVQNTLKALKKEDNEEHEEEMQREKNKKKAKMNLSMKIGNFQRKIMLGGIDQLKQIEQMSQLLRMAEAQGVDTQMTQNFRGKDILIALQNVKLETDRNYFENRSYEDFCNDPLGSGNTDRFTNDDAAIQENIYKQKIHKRNI